MIWNDRTLKIEDGVLWMSSKGNPEGWDFAAPENPAVAGTYGPGKVTEVRVHSDGALLIETTAGSYLLHGDPTDPEARVDLYAKVVVKNGEPIVLPPGACYFEE